MKVVEIKQDQSVKEAIKDFMDREDQFDCVCLVAINKDGSQFLRSSKASQAEKSFMIAFANSWLMKWFWETYE